MSARNAGFMKIVVGLVIAAVVILAVVFFTSDVARTNMKEAADQYAHWTPANIAKDPESYLSFCESEATKAMQDLKASEIAVAQNRARLEAMLKDAQNKIAVGEKALTELKDAFRNATAWPITWQGSSRDQEWTKRQIVSFSRQVEAQKSLSGKVDAGIKKLDAQATKIQEGRAQAQEQIAEIRTSREILKVQKLTDDLTEKMVSIKSVLQATINTASESTGVVTLDQMVAESATAVDQAEFDAIMGK